MEDWSKKQELRKYIPFNQNEYGLLIRNLSEEHIDLMGDFSQKIYSTLRDNEKTFIHHHNRDYYKKSLQQGNKYLWIFDGNKLVGMSNIIICNNKESFDEEVPWSPRNFFEENEKTKIAVFWADSVLPEYRGRGLNKYMVDCRVELAKTLWCNIAASIVDRHNIKNFSPYFKNGFPMYGAGIDPSDNGDIALMFRNIDEKTIDAQNVKALDYGDFSNIDQTLNQWYQGIHYDRETGLITFVKGKKENIKILQHKAA